jgi:hypothetical protein
VATTTLTNTPPIMPPLNWWLKNCRAQGFGVTAITVARQENEAVEDRGRGTKFAQKNGDDR